VHGQCTPVGAAVVVVATPNSIPSGIDMPGGAVAAIVPRRRKENRRVVIKANSQL
jgi:hypothetical protein